MKTFKIKPKKELTVRDPVTREPLKASGEVKPRNLYWLRRLKEGSVSDVAVKAGGES
ncbi:DUF2635 domain-containing protein [Vibrio sp. 10N.261.46.A3]|uniref:DUF2635 domain-containing protein n=1 Tax=Vibrio sp. 10N.261.46.A3 TaxID=3229658 RepID=UPI0035545BE5